MFKRVPWFSLAGVALFLILAMVFLPFIRGKERRLKVENFHLIKKGMTLKEVEELLGGPPGNYGYPSVKGGHSSLEDILTPPTVVKEEHWFNEKNLFEVYFDAKDVVVTFHKRARFEQRLPRTWYSDVWDYLRGFVSRPQQNDPWVHIESRHRLA